MFKVGKQSMKISFFPASLNYNHASSRIRSLSIGEWMCMDGDVPVSWNDRNSDIVVVFKRPELVIALSNAGRYVIFDISDDYLWSEDHRKAYQIADCIVAGTPELAKRVLPYNDRIAYIPDHIDPVAKISKKWRKPWLDHRRHILWFGCWGNKHHTAGGMRDILLIKDELNSLNDLSLTICSNSRERFDSVAKQLFIPAHYEEWDRETFGSLMRQHQAVVVPVVDTPYTRAKSHNRVTTAIVAGVPVMASDMPSYQEFGVTITDWRSALAGQWRPANDKLLEPYSLSKIGERWKDLLTSTSARLGRPE